MCDFHLRLEQMHPGVAGMDAVYRFYSECGGKRSTPGDPVFLLHSDDSDVHVNGCDVIVPYHVRQAQREVVITAELNDYIGGAQATDTYTLRFATVFEEQPAFFDDFETYDLSVWEEGWEYGGRGGRVEDSDLVLEIDPPYPPDQAETCAIVTTANSFKQAFGCFSARMKFPACGPSPRTCNCAFWLCSDVLHPETILFKRNPLAPLTEHRSHAGEIDITEYSPAFGDYTTASIHYNGWGKYLKSFGKGCLPAPGIRDGYHILSLVWEPDALYWYYDGGLIRVYTGEAIEGAGKEPGGEMVVLLQLGTHRLPDRSWKGTWIGRTCDEDLPLQLRTDWVKVHALKRTDT